MHGPGDREQLALPGKSSRNNGHSIFGGVHHHTATFISFTTFSSAPKPGQQIIFSWASMLVGSASRCELLARQAGTIPRILPKFVIMLPVLVHRRFIFISWQIRPTNRRLFSGTFRLPDMAPLPRKAIPSPLTDQPAHRCSFLHVELFSNPDSCDG